MRRLDPDRLHALRLLALRGQERRLDHERALMRRRRAGDASRPRFTSLRLGQPRAALAFSNRSR